MTAFVPTEPAPTDHLVDAGYWRLHGTTHWHVWAAEIGTTDRDRYDAERLRRLDARARAVTDPREVLAWVVEQRLDALRQAPDAAAAARRAGWATPEAWRERTEVTWELITGASLAPAGGGVAISDGRSVDIFAVPMTARDCSRHSRRA
ncbi:MAG: hypothetical protein M3235_20045 [Actinomycetota bacterium]|nr:hypothetical protein [Actinomycetota bacterium]